MITFCFYCNTVNGRNFSCCESIFVCAGAAVFSVIAGSAAIMLCVAVGSCCCCFLLMVPLLPFVVVVLKALVAVCYKYNYDR